MRDLGARREQTSPLGSASQGSTSLGNLTGFPVLSPGVDNATGGFVSAGLSFPSGPGVGLTDVIANYTLFIKSSALATGGVNFKFVASAGTIPIFTVSGTGASTVLFASKNAVGNGAVAGPFCTFDCSTVATIGAGGIQIRATIIGMNIAGTCDLQFQNVVGAETYSIVVDSSLIVTRFNA